MVWKESSRRGDLKTGLKTQNGQGLAGVLWIRKARVREFKNGRERVFACVCNAVYRLCEIKRRNLPSVVHTHSQNWGATSIMTIIALIHRHRVRVRRNMWIYQIALYTWQYRGATLVNDLVKNQVKHSEYRELIWRNIWPGKVKCCAE